MAEPPQTKPADNSLRDIGLSFLTLGGLVLGGLYYNPQSSIGNPQSSITLIWDDTSNPRGSFTTEVWASTNLSTWTLKTNIAGTNRVTLPADQSREFFKIRNRGTNGTFSDWSRKPTL